MYLETEHAHEQTVHIAQFHQKLNGLEFNAFGIFEPNIFPVQSLLIVMLIELKEFRSK